MSLCHALLKSKPTSTLTRLWGALLICVVVYFSVTCIEQIALDRALQLHDALPTGRRPTPKGTPRSAHRQRNGHQE